MTNESVVVRKEVFAQQKQSLRAVILAGGNGTRLWPLSREQRPKQFLSLDDGNEILLESTVRRLQPYINPEDVLVVTSEKHASGEAYQALTHYQTLLEPVGRNTAPAIALAAEWLLRHSNGADPIMVVLPADHVIKDKKAFHQALEKAIKAAEEGALVTFGIRPTHPDTGFGYIKVAGSNESGEPVPAEHFAEKPDVEIAKRYLEDGSYCWNSGMFVWRASTILNAIENNIPEIAEVLSELNTACENGEDTQHVINRIFHEMPDVSIDVGVLEKSAGATGNLVVIPCEIAWSDIGSWDAVYQIQDKDQSNNVVRGNAFALDCNNSLIHSNHRLITAVGVDDVCLVETADAIMLTKRGETQRVREVVDELKRRRSQQHILHLKVQRPWGSYTVLEEEPGFKMKRITVNTGGKLSLQRHQHRSEHWIVVSGTATVICEDEVRTVTTNQSTYIPVGSKHKLENRGKIPLQLIEVQVGEYLEEDDIERFDDSYGRC